MSRSLGKLIADKYINEDGSEVHAPPKPKKELTPAKEQIVLNALREICDGDTRKIADAKRIAMNALNDVFMPYVPKP